MTRLILITLFLFPLTAFAQIFGPKNFDQCMNDGKVGRTNAELALKHKECRNKFPALPSIKNKSNKDVDCQIFNSNFVFTAKVKNDGSVTISDFTTDKISVISFTNEKLLVKWKKKEVGDVYFELDYINGIFKISSDSKSDSGECSETR